MRGLRVPFVSDFTFKLDPAKSPAQIDLVSLFERDKGKTFQGIYELNGDTLKLCLSRKEGDRPRSFTPRRDDAVVLFELRRVKK